MVVQEQNTSFDKIFYARVTNGKWTAKDTGLVYYPSLSKDFQLGAANSPANATQPNYVAVSTKPNSNIKTVVVYTRIKGHGSDIPFALSKIGNLPVWVYKYTVPTFASDYVVAYDSNGKVVWSNKP